MGISSSDWDPTTWWNPNQIIDANEEKLGRYQVRIWPALHFQQSAKHPMHLILVERLCNEANKTRKRPLWLVWVGEGIPQLHQIWRQYLRRFAIDHWYRFAKQRLHWTLPKLSTPEQCQRWSDLMPLLTWELWLARKIVIDNPHPWQKSTATNLTPGRVAQSMAGVLAAIGTPSQPPKPRGKSPGWPEGQPRSRRIHYPTVKKGTAKPTKQPSKSA